MQYFYDGQIRRYVLQTIRALSNFAVRYGDGTLVRVPVMYGDMDRQVATILSQNSENIINSCPRIAVYVTQLTLDREQLRDSTYVGKVHIRERDTDIDPYTGNLIYNTNQGRNYTVERGMPVPYKLSMKADIWAASTEQKLQILEQILILFTPSLEIQTTDNYIDWTSLSILNLSDVIWSSKTLPVGTELPIDVATLMLDAPIWISAPAKVKRLGVITKIITSVYDTVDTTWTGIDALGADPNRGGTTTFTDLLYREITTITDYKIQVYDGKAMLLGAHENVLPRNAPLSIPVKQGLPINWKEVFELYPNNTLTRLSKLFLTQKGGYEVIGTIELDAIDPTILNVEWDVDTYPADDMIITTGDRESGGGRSAGTFDAIIDPQRICPGNGIADLRPGDRFLIIENIGSIVNQNGPSAWKNNDGSDFYATANDIIEWQTTHWAVIFDSASSNDTLIYQTNIYNGKRIQYCWNGMSWVKSFEGEYDKGQWRIEL
jgi:hypothetical protein